MLQDHASGYRPMLSSPMAPHPDMSAPPGMGSPEVLVGLSK